MDASSLDGKALLQACDTDSWNEAKSMLASATAVTDIDAVDADGRTSIFLAARNGDPDMVERLLAFGADASVSSKLSGTPLVAACLSGHEAVAVALLASARAGSLDAQEEKGTTALYGAALLGSMRLVGLLLDGGADPSLAGWRDGTPLRAAAQGGHADVVAALLATGRHGDIDAKTSGGRTSLHFAAAAGHLGAARALLGAGANPCAHSSLHGSPLAAASSAGHAEVVSAMLATGRCLDLSGADAHGRGAMYRAAEGGHTDVVAMLTEAGASPAAQSRREGPPLVATARGGHFGTVRALLATGLAGDVDAACGDGRTALFWASRLDDVAAVRMLLDAGASRPAHGLNGETPASIATWDITRAMREWQEGQDGRATAADGAGAEASAPEPVAPARRDPPHGCACACA